MATQFDFVNAQLNTYRDQCEPWENDHKDAMACRNLEDAIRLGLMLFDSIVRKWDAPPRVHASSAQKICEMMIWWKNETRRLLVGINRMEEKDYKVDGAESIREKFRLVLNSSDQLERMRAAMESLLNGGATSLEEFKRGLARTTQR